MPLIWISAAFLGGILTADLLPWSELPWFVFLGIMLFLLSGRLLIPIWMEVEFSNIPFWTLGLVCAASFSLGAIRYLRSFPDHGNPEFIANHVDPTRSVVVNGVVKGFPKIQDEYTSIIVETEKLRDSSNPIHMNVEGKILARVPVGEEVQYGDRIMLRGLLRQPPEREGFSYRAFLARRGMYAYMPNAKMGVLESGQGTFFMRAISSLKRASLQKIYKLWPDPEASLLAGILLGEESGIPDSVERAFRDTGTSHIIAISGFNITIVSGFLAAAFSRLFKPFWGALGAVLGISVYTILVGADAAVVRAAWMGGLALFARQVGRRQHGINAVAFAALIMAICNPHIPWDISFQLSLAATLGLVLYAEDLTEWFMKIATHVISSDRAQRLAKPVSEYVLFTFAAQITTLPVLLYHFQSLSWIGFLANPVILPAQPPIMILGGVALIFGLLWLPLGKWIGLSVYPFVTYTIRFVELFAGLESGVIHTERIGLFFVILFYGILAGMTFGRKWLGALSRLVDPAVVILILACGNMLVWRSLFHAPDGYLRLSFLEVGTGSAILLRSPRGERVLINGGPSSSALADGLGRRLSVLDKEIDLWVIASPLEEDIAALTRLVEINPPQSVLWVGARSPSRAADYLRASLQESDVRILDGEVGTSVQIGEKLVLEVLTETERGGILFITYDRLRALLPFGVSKDCFHDLRQGRDIGPISLLLLADNGYYASNPKKWIGNLNPRLIVLSVAPDDPDGLPSPALLEDMAGYSLLRTDVHGWIEFTTDGQQMWIDVARLP